MFTSRPMLQDALTEILVRVAAVAWCGGFFLATHAAMTRLLYW